MKFFLDTAIVEDIRWAANLGIVDGVTTNPSLIARSGRKFEEVVKEITEIVDGPISAEAVSLEAEKMVEEARKLAKIHKNIVVKIPFIEEGIKAVKVLSKEGIRTNVTLIFSASQALIAAKVGANYVSPFIGRIDDTGARGMNVVEETVEIFENYGYQTEVIVASIRHPLHVIEAAVIGAHIATIPPPILKKMISHPLTDKGVKMFLEDWKKVPK
ncbi:MAG: fructose-6-phosphate aldolase [Candidatus Omnitrophica bacterium]|nr:fructose-6-phosphate aldolase [Candidatus Omnitrophota bacterium]